MFLLRQPRDSLRIHGEREEINAFAALNLPLRLAEAFLERVQSEVRLLLVNQEGR
jgi:hypothetical protein